jgi:hypothetical protein
MGEVGHGVVEGLDHVEFVRGLAFLEEGGLLPADVAVELGGHLVLMVLAHEPLAEIVAELTHDLAGQLVRCH